MRANTSFSFAVVAIKTKNLVFFRKILLDNMKTHFIGRGMKLSFGSAIIIDMVNRQKFFVLFAATATKFSIVNKDFVFCPPKIVCLVYLLLVHAFSKSKLSFIFYT